MPTCETCKWWDRINMMRGDCRDEDAIASVNNGDGLETDADFGCIYHQPKETEDE